MSITGASSQMDWWVYHFLAQWTSFLHSRFTDICWAVGHWRFTLHAHKESFTLLLFKIFLL